MDNTSGENLFVLANGPGIYELNAPDSKEAMVKEILAYANMFDLGHLRQNHVFLRYKQQTLADYNPYIGISPGDLPKQLKDVKFHSEYGYVFKKATGQASQALSEEKPLYVSISDVSKDVLIELRSRLRKVSHDARCNLLRYAEIGHIPEEDMDRMLIGLDPSSMNIRLDHTTRPPSLIFGNWLEKSGSQFFEDEIVFKFYLMPYLAGNSNLWLRARVCQECGKIFPYKQERARFCSQKCGMKEANRKRRSK